jgi:hypothetical protein
MSVRNAKLSTGFLMTIYNKRFQKIIRNENIQKMFLQGKSNGFVVLTTFF